MCIVFVCVHAFMCGVWVYVHVRAFVMQCVSVCVSVRLCECGCVYVHVCTCLCAHVHIILLDSAQKLEDGHDVCCVCVCMYICGVYLACVYSVGAVRQSSGMRLDGPVGIGIVWE